VVGNTDPVSLTDAELAAEVARDTGEVLLAVTHPGGSHPAGKSERTVLPRCRTPLELERPERNR